MEDKQQAGVDLVEELKRKYLLPSQVIVYCGTKNRTVEIARVLGAVCYHQAVESIEEKKEIVQQLTSGKAQVFTATNALGLGINAPTIQAVVHIGIVQKMRHYAQESRQAGHNSEVSEAIIMRLYRETQQGRVYSLFSKDVEEEVQELIGGQGCMRRVINDAIDRSEQRWGCEEDEAPCQRCRGSGGARQTGREEAARLAAAEQTEVEFEQQGMARWRWGLQEMEQQARDAGEVEELAELMEE
jgi:superfamily II DNA helicase RecQ